jgi:hypothetical protein
VIGPQQQYLEKMQDLMHECGREGKSGFLRPVASMSLARTRSTEVKEAKTSGLLADMVTGHGREREREREREKERDRRGREGASEQET